MELDLAGHRILIQSILQGKMDGIRSEQAELIETHISSVIVSKGFVYKFKKPLNLGFLDFSTLEKRHFYCDEELRLNRRLSPDLYLDVLPVYGSAEAPSLQQQGEVLEYLVRMKPFPQQAQLDRLLHQQQLSHEQILQFARFIADFHQSAEFADRGLDFGKPEQVMKPVLENFQQIGEREQRVDIVLRLDRLKQWSEGFMQQHENLFLQRKQKGYIRECHGDLHLRNLAWMDGAPLAFDCIEFDPNLYWIDVINDIAFLLMDLYDQRQQELAQSFLNQYLEMTGDFQGLTLLRFYMLYRALVRAKIEAITAQQSGIAENTRRQALHNFERYLALGETLTETVQPLLIIMHGPSASGKSTLSRQFAGALPAMVLRSDVERKRLFGKSAEQSMASDFGQGIYSDEATQKTYDVLRELAATIIDAGYSVIIDATFNKPAQRQVFQQLAQQKSCRFVILDLKVPESVLRQRVLQRRGDVSDADIEVLKQQLANWQPLQTHELSLAIEIDAAEEVDVDTLVARIRA